MLDAETHRRRRRFPGGIAVPPTDRPPTPQIPPGLPPATVTGPRGVPDDWVAPYHTRDLPSAHLGRQRPPPWETHRVTCNVPHLASPELLEACVPLLLLQDERPLVHVIDTGSPWAMLPRLEALRGLGVEIHYLRGHAYPHSSDPVALAIDVSLVRTQTEYLFLTHADCFPRRRDLLGDLVAQCGPQAPVVGYQLTDRSHHTTEWRWMVGHTCTIIHVPTIRRLGLQWSYAWGRDTGVRPAGEVYFDTETEFNWGLKRAGVMPVLIGTERNYQRNVNADFDHVRSAATNHIYATGPTAYRAHLAAWQAAALREAQDRIARWRKPRVPLGTPHCPSCTETKR